MDAGGFGDGGGLFDDEIGAGRGVESDEGEAEGFGRAGVTVGQIGEGHGAGINLVEIPLVVDIHRFYWEFEDGAEAGG